LTRAGVGRLQLIDRDYVDFSNLQRQWLYSEEDARNELPKAVAAANRLKQLNSRVQIETAVVDFDPANAEDLAASYDLLLDATDNFETRYLINDVSVKLGIPWIYGAAVSSYGIVLPLLPDRGPCFACVYPDRPSGLQPTCDTNGVIASITASVAALQVSLALHLIVGWDDFRPAIYTLDIWQPFMRAIRAGEKDPSCEVCRKRKFAHLEGRNRRPVSLCGRNAVQLHEHQRPINLSELAGRLQHLGRVRLNELALHVELPQYGVTIFPDGRAIVKGTTDVGRARNVYADLLGA
jgi:adenylyltransferase/sulfurtransferase